MPDGVTIDRLMRLPEVVQVVGLSRTTIYDRVAKGTFPAPMQLGPASVAWVQSEVNEWIKSLPRTRGLRRAPPAPTSGAGGEGTPPAA